MLVAEKMSRETSFTEERRQLLMETLQAIAQRKRICGLCSIYHGGNVDVYTAHDPKRNKPTAVKITTGGDVNGNALWPTLNHDNLLRVLDTFSLTVLDTPITVYVSPYKELSLEAVIESNSFGLRGNDHRRMRGWLGQVLRGLEYLHAKGLCHLNLTTGSVVLTHSRQRALLCDFDHLRKSSEPLQRAHVGLPWSFQPPEAELNGTTTDLWSYGMLVVECYTKQAIAYAALEAIRITWEAEMLPIMHHILQEQEFTKLFRSAYPECVNPERKVRKILDLAHRFLKADPRERMSKKDHPGFGLRTRTEARDPIWNPVTQVSPFEPAPTPEVPVEPTQSQLIPDVPIELVPTPEVPVEPIQGQQTPDVPDEPANNSPAQNVPQQTPEDTGIPAHTPEVTVEPSQTPDVSVEPAHVTNYQKVQLLLYVNRLVIKAKHEFRDRYLGSSESAEPSQKDQPDAFPEPDPVPKPEVVKAAFKTKGQKVRGTAEFEEPSYFNLKSLELSSRFTSSSDPKPVVEKRFPGLQRAFSRAARFFGLKRKTTP